MVIWQNFYTKQRIGGNQRGVALGPILFIIAILAILAAAIATGSGAFRASTNDENAKAMAELILNNCRDFQNALQVMQAQSSCDITKMDFTPKGGWPAGTTWNTADYTGGNGTNQSGNGQCAVFDPRGGGIQFKPLPKAALVADTTVGYTTAPGATKVNMDAFAGYPLLDGSDSIVGGSSLGSLVLGYTYLDSNVCTQINTLLKNNFSISSASTVYTHSMGSIYNNTNVGANDPTAPQTYTGHSPNVYAEGCAADYYGYASQNIYFYICPVVIR